MAKGIELLGIEIKSEFKRRATIQLDKSARERARVLLEEEDKNDTEVVNHDGKG